VPVPGTEAQRRAAFGEEAGAGRWWGLFEGEHLRSIASLNAAYATTGQVGGVYTTPEHRGRGLAASVIRTLMRDAVERHGLRTLILFTGETNAPARRVYEGVGFVPVGHFGLLFGDHAA